MPLPKTQPLNYRLRAPHYYQPNPQSVHYPPDDVQPYDVAIFSETLSAGQSDESQYITPREMWLESIVASAGVGTQANPAFGFQILQVISENQGEQAILVAQEYPTNTTTKTGTAKQAAVYKRMQYFPPGAELVCNVSNLQNAANAIQIVLRMYVRNLPNTPQAVGNGQN